MLKSKVLLEKVNGIYFNFKTERYSIAHHNEQILSKNEKYLELTNELGQTKFLLAKAEYAGDEFEIIKLKSQAKTLEELIEKLKSTLPVIKYQYKCNICNDTGIYNGERCKCFNRYLTEIILQSLEIPKTKGIPFSNVIPNPNLNKQFKIMKNYADNFPNTKINNLVLCGSVGTGKTMLAKCVFKSLENTDSIAIFLTATDLNNIFLKVHTSQIDRTLTFDILSNCDLLIIDDLGTENTFKNVTIEYLLSLLSYRIDNNKHFIITTNLTSKELYERYNERLFSRLSDKTKTLFLPFNSEDMRRRK